MKRQLQDSSLHMGLTRSPSSTDPPIPYSRMHQNDSHYRETTHSSSVFPEQHLAFNIFTPVSSDQSTRGTSDVYFAEPQGRAPRPTTRGQASSSSNRSHQSSRSNCTATPQARQARFLHDGSLTPLLTQTPRTPRTGAHNRQHQENVIVALVNGRGIARNEVGVAAIYLTSAELNLCQMSDSHGYIKTITKLNIFRPTEVIVPDTLVTPGSVSPLVQCIRRFDPDVTITPAKRSIFNDAAGIQYIKQLAVQDRQNVVHLIEQK